MSRKTPEILEVDPHQLQEVVRRAAELLDQQDAELIRAVFESYAYVVELVVSFRQGRKKFRGMAAARFWLHGARSRPA
jgi:hypothetical protein